MSSFFIPLLYSPNVSRSPAGAPRAAAPVGCSAVLGGVSQTRDLSSRPFEFVQKLAIDLLDFAVKHEVPMAANAQQPLIQISVQSLSHQEGLKHFAETWGPLPSAKPFPACSTLPEFADRSFKINELDKELSSGRTRGRFRGADLLREPLRRLTVLLRIDDCDDEGDPAEHRATGKKRRDPRQSHDPARVVRVQGDHAQARNNRGGGCRNESCQLPMVPLFEGLVDLNERLVGLGRSVHHRLDKGITGEQKGDERSDRLSRCAEHPVDVLCTLHVVPVALVRRLTLYFIQRLSFFKS
jgi:hypothetical protein